MKEKKGLSNRCKVYLVLCGPMLFFYLFFVMILEPVLTVALRDPTQDYRNLWKDNELFDVRLYLSSSSKLDFLDKKSFKLLHQETDLLYSTEKYSHGKVFTFNYTLPFTDKMRHNKTKPHYILLISPSECHFQTDTDIKCKNLIASYNIVRWEDKDHPYRYDNINFDLVYDLQPRNLSVSLSQYNWYYYQINPSSRTYAPPLTNDSFMEIPQNQIPIDMTMDRPSMNASITFRIKGYFAWDFKLHVDSSLNRYKLTEDTLNKIKHFIYVSQPAVIYGYTLYFILNGVFKLICIITEYQWWIDGDFDGKSLYTPILCIICHIVAITNILMNQGSVLELVVRSFAALFALYKANSMFESVWNFPYFALHPSNRRTKKVDLITGVISILVLLFVGCASSILSLLVAPSDAIDIKFILSKGLTAITTFECISLIPQIIVNFAAKSVAGMPKGCVQARFGGAVMDDLYLLFTQSNLLCFLNLIVPAIYMIQCMVLPSKNPIPLPKIQKKKENKEKVENENKGEVKQNNLGTQEDVQKRTKIPETEK